MDSFAAWFGGVTSGVSLFEGVTPEYLICLFAFGAAVILYTTYGGFHAVVWTDVMQGVVMVIGVLLMLPIAIYLAGGLPSATKSVAEMTPPIPTKADIVYSDSSPRPSNGEWLNWDDGNSKRLFKVVKAPTAPSDAAQAGDGELG